MVLWIIFAVMTAAACLFLLQPFQSSDDKGRHTLSSTDIYKDQLSELEREYSEGLISADDMEAAKIEISRRILNSSEETNIEAPSQSAHPRYKKTVLLILIIVPLVSLSLYLWVGQPNFVPVTQNQINQSKLPSTEELLRRVEAHLEKNPDDIKGWSVLARVYANMGRKEDVKRATDNIERIRKAAPNIQNMSDAERRDMIKSMVAGLHEKLKADGSSVEGWERLIQSYIVLGQKEAARSSFIEALEALSDNEDAVTRLKNFGRRFSFEK